MSTKFDKYKKDIDRSTFVRYSKNYLNALFGDSKVAPLWVADSDFMVMPELTKAMKRVAKRALFPYELKTPAIKEPMIKWFAKRHKIKIKTEGLLFTTSVLTGLAAAIDELTTKGDGIIIQPPVYNAFKGLIEGIDRKVVNNQLKLVDGKYEMDFKDLEKKAAAKSTKAMILCSPHNPVGRVWTPEELERVANVCIANNVLMLTDEIHCDIIYSKSAFTGMTEVYKGNSDQIIMFGSAGKSFGIPGLVDSFIYSPNEEYKKTLQSRIMRFHLGKSNSFGIVAMKTVYKHGFKWLDKKLSYLEETVTMIDDFLKKNLPQVKLVKPEGTYQVWLDFSAVAKNDEELSELLFKKAKVGIGLGSMYGPGGEGYARMNIASPKPMIIDALKAIEKAVKE